MTRRTSEDVLAWIDMMALTSRQSAAAIYRESIPFFDPERLLPSVSERTVRNRVNETRAMTPPPDPDGAFEYSAAPWSLTDADDPEDAALMLAMITEMVDDSAGSYPRISRGLARWMIRLRRIVGPGLPAGTVSYFGTLYLRRQWAGEPTDDLDAFLAFAPWRSEKATWVYQEACKRKAVRPLIGMMGLHPSAWQPPPGKEPLSEPVKRRKAGRETQ